MRIFLPEKHITWTRIYVARSFFDRLIGLTRYRKPVDFVMVFENCRVIHTFGMAYPIDVVFVDEYGAVLSAATVKPYSLSTYVTKAKYCIELPVGSASLYDIQKGSQLNIDV